MTETKRVILLGTGTDVGKTYVGVGLIRALRELGRDVLALKPVESGLTPTPPGVLPTSGDAAALAQVATLGAAPKFGLVDAVSPHLAARHEGVSIAIAPILEWVLEREEEFLKRQPRRPVIVIETAGGCFSPLSDETTNFDLACALDPAEWVLVAPDSLGVLHDLNATLRAILRRPPDFLTLSEARARDASTGTNAEEVERVIFCQLAGQLRLPQVFPIPRDGDARKMALALDRKLG